MGRDIAIDLGTANTLVSRPGDGIVLREPTVVAIDTARSEVVAIGEQAWAMVGGDSGNVIAMQPLRAGTITEFEVTERFVRSVIKSVGLVRFPRPRILMCVPSGASEIERRAVEESIAGGGRQVTLVEEPLAAAIGAGLPVHEPTGHLIVDIGGGRSQMAIVSMGGIVTGHTIHVGGFHLDDAIAAHVKDSYGVKIGERASEEVKVAIASAFPSGDERAAIVIGRDIGSGHAVEVKLEEGELRAAMSVPIRRIVEAARRTLGEAPPELTHDVVDSGMFLSGGGALLRGMDLLLSQECEVPVHVVEHPLEAVVSGADTMLRHLDDYRSAFQLVRGRSGG